MTSVESGSRTPEPSGRPSGAGASGGGGVREKSHRPTHHDEVTTDERMERVRAALQEGWPIDEMPHEALDSLERELTELREVEVWASRVLSAHRNRCLLPQDWDALAATLDALSHYDEVTG